MRRLRDLAAVILACSALLGSLASFVAALKAKADVVTAEARQDDNVIHTAVQEGLEDIALREQIDELRGKIAALEAAGGRR